MFNAKRVARRRVMLVAGALLCAPASAAMAQGVDSTRDKSVAERMADFLVVFEAPSAADLARFFPRNGDFELRRSLHTPDSISIMRWRFPADQVVDALRGPLWDAFNIEIHGQTVGLFAHQVLERGTPWVQVSPTRFVPPGENERSVVYVEWRYEGTEWVIHEIADEYFAAPVPLPCWALHSCDVS